MPRKVKKTEASLPEVQLPPLRMFKVTRWDPRHQSVDYGFGETTTFRPVVHELTVTAHAVVPTDKLLQFVEIALVEGVPIQRITRAFYGWISYEEVSVPMGGGSVQ